MIKIIFPTVLALIQNILSDLNDKYHDLLIEPSQSLTALHVQTIYQDYLSYYQKEHSSLKYENFKNTIQEIVQHNSLKDKTYTMGLNQFSDMSNEEFLKLYTMQAEQKCSATAAYSERLSNIAIPDYFDWRDKGKVSPVKN